MDRAAELLQSVFGFPAFRPGQAEIVQSVLEGRNTLAIMPTGGGKSLCFQLPALCREGVTVVISPLIALMRDQVRALRAAGVRVCLAMSMGGSSSGIWWTVDDLGLVLRPGVAGDCGAGGRSSSGMSCAIA